MNPSTALGRTLVDELIRCGIAEVVLAPGSRSAPLAFALHDADAAGRLRLHVRIDERSAGFLALGLARSAGIAAVVTTSGTAVANLHPAVVEADHAGVPVVVISADRPAELRGVGANQTIDQVGIFGRSVRQFHEVSAPARATGDEPYWRATVSRAVLAARGAVIAEPGPVHLNVAFREPLVPHLGTDDPPAAGRPGGKPWIEAVGGSDAPSAALDLPPRTLVVVGDAAASTQRAGIALAARRGWPVLAEPAARAGGAVTVDCAALVLSASEWLAAHGPDHVLMVGRPTLSRAVNRLLREASAVTAVGSSHWVDPVHTVQAVYPAGALASTPDDAGAPEFSAAWRKAGERARSAVDEVLTGERTPTSLGVAGAITAALPAESLLYLGSSSAARDVDLVGGPTLPAHVHANRGASGIDGTVSSAMGAALALPGVPAYGLMGDLTFIHDANGLVIGPDEPRPDLCLVVVNDDGGGIFALLEQGAPEYSGSFERIFGTPHGVDLAALCAATGTGHEIVDLPDLPAAVAYRPGVRVVEVRVSRSRHRDLHARLRQAVAAALVRT